MWVWFLPYLRLLQVFLPLALTSASRMLEPLLTNAETSRQFVERGGTDVLLKIYQLPKLTVRGTSAASVQCSSHLCVMSKVAAVRTVSMPRAHTLCIVLDGRLHCSLLAVAVSFLPCAHVPAYRSLFVCSRPSTSRQPATRCCQCSGHCQAHMARPLQPAPRTLWNSRSPSCCPWPSLLVQCVSPPCLLSSVTST